MPISSATKSGHRGSARVKTKPPSGPLKRTWSPGVRPRNHSEPIPAGATSAQSVSTLGDCGVEAIEYARTVFGPNGTDTHWPASNSRAAGSSMRRSTSRISGESRRTASTRARHSRGFTARASARPDAREDLRGDRLELLPLVTRVADRAQEEVRAAGVAERRELLGALLGRPDDPVLLGERLEILRVAPGEHADPRLPRALVIAPHRDEREVRAGETGERPAGGVGRLTDLLEAPRVALGLDDVGHPAVPLTAGADQRGVGAPTHPNRWKLLHGLGVDRDALEPAEPAMERRGCLAPESAHHVDPLGHARPPLRVGDAAELELLRVLAAHPHAEDQAAPAQDVDRRRDLRGDCRRAERQQVHRGAEPDPPRDGRVGGEERERLVERVVEGDVVPGPHRVEAELLDALHERELLLGGMHGELCAESRHALTSETRP